MKFSVSSRLSKRIQAVAAYERLKSYKGAARQVKSDVHFVRKWVKRKQAGLGLGDRPRAGRNKLLRLDQDKVVDLVLTAMDEGKGPPQIANLLKDKCAIEAHKETVRRFMKTNLGRPLTPRKKPKLTDRHKRDRLAFSRKWLRRDWSNVVVTDSKYFWLCPKGSGPKKWVRYGHSAPDKPAERNCFKVHGYAGVCRAGRTPLFETVGTTGLKAETKGVTGKVYKALLHDKLIPACKDIVTSEISWIFQQDNAKAHTCREVQQWLNDQDFELMKWPAKSPDLSWIENMWAYVTNVLNRVPGLTPQNFTQHLNTVWNSIPREVHDGHFKSIRKRLQACIDANGGSTKY